MSSVGNNSNDEKENVFTSDFDGGLGSGAVAEEPHIPWGLQEPHTIKSPPEPRMPQHPPMRAAQCA